MNLEHIHPDFRHIVGLSDAERIDFLDMPRWIGYKTAQHILDTLQGLMNKPPRPRMPNLLLVSDPNNGKSTIVKRFCNLYGQGYVNEDGEAVKPIVIAESPPSADEKGLYASILEQFYAPYRATDPATKLRYQVIHQLRNCHTKVLVIDELNSLLTGAAIKQREVMNTIKLICNEVAIPIVGVGTREAVRVLHTDPQHASRFDVITLPAWELNSDFQRFLVGFEKVLPLKKASKIHEPELATLIHLISEGNTGNIQRLLKDCAEDAIKNGSEQITKDIVQNRSWQRPTKGFREIMF